MYFLSIVFEKSVHIHMKVIEIKDKRYHYAFTRFLVPTNGKLRPNSWLKNQRNQRTKNF